LCEWPYRTGRNEQRNGGTRCLDATEPRPGRKAQTVQECRALGVANLREKSKRNVLLLAHEAAAMIAQQGMTRMLCAVGAGAVPDATVKAENAAGLAFRG